MLSEHLLTFVCDRTGHVSKVVIKNDGDPNDKRQFSDVMLQLTTFGSNLQVQIRTPVDNEVIQGCFFKSSLSRSATIDCLRDGFESMHLRS